MPKQGTKRCAKINQKIFGKTLDKIGYPMLS
nr:MAG TPA: hypothetical protein [Caudoviricetes sp.]